VSDLTGWDDMKIHSYTRQYEGLSRTLTIPVKIVSIQTGKHYETNGIIDTGATGSVISENIAVELGLLPLTYTFVNTASEQNVVTPIYELHIEFDNGIRIVNVKVTAGTLLKGAECLIGMDILTLGDLAVTNWQKKTCVSFRIPSVNKIDFVDAANKSKPVVSAKKPGRNDPCPCGSEKKYKNCCGMNAQ
jgi:predicted aspartyl protease